MPKKSKHQKMLAAKRRAQEPTEISVTTTVPKQTAVPSSRTYSIAGTSSSSSAKITPYSDTSYLGRDMVKILILSVVALGFEAGLRFLIHVNPALLHAIPFLSGLTF